MPILTSPYRYINVTHASRVLQSHDLSREGISCVSHIYFLDQTRTWRASPQLSAGATSETTRTLKTIHIINSHIHSNKANMRRMIMMARLYSGTFVICLRDRRECYRLLHSGDPLTVMNLIICPILNGNKCIFIRLMCRSRYVWCKLSFVS